ncbi:MAG: DUF4159 domain-containing protein [Ignavibacteriaceae bacterium]
MKKLFFIIYLITTAGFSFPQNEGAFQIARLQYDGGGDWYNDQTEEPNLLDFIKDHTNIKVKDDYTSVNINSDEIFSYPFLFMTGHGNISFTPDEVERLRKYCENGGFLYADDDYGMNAAFRREIKKVFPGKDLVELPFSYGLYHDFYEFPNGVPKIQEHNDKPPQGFGIFINGRLAVYYTYESNPSDGWDDPDVHGDPPEKRLEALKFGTNLVIWALSN